jgi:hypothetical protein
MGRVREGRGSMLAAVLRKKAIFGAPMVTEASIRGRKSEVKEYGSLAPLDSPIYVDTLNSEGACQTRSGEPQLNTIGGLDGRFVAVLDAARRQQSHHLDELWT